MTITMVIPHWSAAAADHCSEGLEMDCVNGREQTLQAEMCKSQFEANRSKYSAARCLDVAQMLLQLT